LSLYASIVRPVLFRLPAESAHELAIHSLSLALRPSFVRKSVARKLVREPFGPLARFGLEFSNPLGLAAGFDKNGTAAQALAALGFGFVEVGTVTSHAQPGNQRPRLFRLPADQALINRAGFNNCGAAALAANISRRRPNCMLGINIGKSRDVPIEEAVPDYLASFDAVFSVADYIAVNVSSPNTPNLRELQRADLLNSLLGALQQRNREMANALSLSGPRPLLLKIAPDVTEGEIESIVGVALANNIAGIIATNTTIRRDGLQTSPEKIKACGEGGLSGAPLRGRSNEIIALVYRLTNGKLPIIGVGGIFTAEDAWEKLSAGAGLVQLYTGFIYKGPGVAKNINEGLAEIMKREGFESLDQAVGSRAEH